ncbi:MAG: hypothetical protein ACFCUV_22410 [Rivularia sp. (in: cyanobacteria)]
MTSCYDLGVTTRHDIMSMVKQLPQVKRRDEGTSAIQSFFTLKEKEVVKDFCDRMGWDASHFMRCLALQYIASEGERVL